MQRVLQNDFGGNRTVFYDQARDSRRLGDFLKDHQLIDHNSMYDFLLYTSMLPPRTPLQGVSLLFPGERREGEVSTFAYHDLDIKVKHRPLSFFVEAFDALLKEYFKTPGVGAAVTLSGGIDSAIIVSYLGKEMPCLTWDAWPESSDMRHSRETVRAFGVVTHKTVSSDYDRDFEAYKKAVQTLKIPISFSQSVPCARMAEAATEMGIKKMFMGTNADTLFMSHPPTSRAYQFSSLNRFLPFNPFFFWKDRRNYLLSTASPARLLAFYKSNGIFPGPWIRLPEGYFEEKERLIANGIHANDNAQRVILTEEFMTEARKNQTNNHEVPDVWNVDVDCPYYSRLFIELALSIPQSLRRKENYNKVFFKELARKRGVPESVINHAKKGLSYGAKQVLQKNIHVATWNAMEKDELMNRFIDIKRIRAVAERNFYTFDQLQSLYWWGQWVALPEGLRF